MPITVAASPPLPCNAITGRKASLCPGGRAIAQLVSTPRAAEANDPVTNVGAAFDGGAGSPGGGAPTAVATPSRRSAHSAASPRRAA